MRISSLRGRSYLGRAPHPNPRRVRVQNGGPASRATDWREPAMFNSLLRRKSREKNRCGPESADLSDETTFDIKQIGATLPARRAGSGFAASREPNWPGREKAGRFSMGIPHRLNLPYG